MKTVTSASLRCQIKSGRLCVTHSGKVYDVTEFADRHPGGREFLESNAGRDVTQAMDQQNHVHSQAARKIMDKYCIGVLETSAVQETTTTTVTEEVTDTNVTNGSVKHRAVKNGHKNGHVNGYTNGITQAHSDTNSDKASTQVEQNLDDLVDLSKPVFWQVGALGERYFEWVHSPMDTSLRLFQSDIIETLSKSWWWLVLLYWVPVNSAIFLYALTLFMKPEEPVVWNLVGVGVGGVTLSKSWWWLVLLYWVPVNSAIFLYALTLFMKPEEPVVWNLVGVGAVEVTASWVPLLFVCGLLLWTFDEYVVHRWLFHCKPPAWSKFLIAAHFLFHGQHHKSPMDKHRLVFPPLPATGLGILIYLLYSQFAPMPIALVLFCGTIVGYLCYDLIHYYLHHGGQPSLTYFRNLKMYHTKHHYKEQNKGFGISSKMWDYPFGTLIKS